MTHPSHDSHSLRGAVMLLSTAELLLPVLLGFWLCPAWLLFWFWPAWFWFWAGLWVWPDLGLEPSVLLPMLLLSCRRLMWRTTAVALKACCGESGVRERKIKTPPQHDTNANVRHCEEGVLSRTEHPWTMFTLQAKVAQIQTTLDLFLRWRWSGC